MSTRASVIYDEESGVHIFEELLDGHIYLELDRQGVNLSVKLMSTEQWQKLGLPICTKFFVDHNSREDE